MVFVILFFVQQLLMITGCLAELTTVPLTHPGNEWGDGGTCEGFESSLYDSPLTTFQFKPKPSYSNWTSITWKSFGKSRPQVILNICEFTSIVGISFNSVNVKSSGIIVNDESYYGAVDQYGKVTISTTFGSMTYAKVGWSVKITVTPKDYSKPVEIKNLEVKICARGYDCFDDCAMYVLDSSTGCKRPICRGDPCSELDCSDGQECRLIEGEPVSTFASVMTVGVQLWGCVDKSRTDYGCACKKYKNGENQCPTCSCG